MWEGLLKENESNFYPLHYYQTQKSDYCVKMLLDVWDFPGGPVVKNPPLGFPRGSDGKESACNTGDLGLIPRWGRSPGGGNGNPLQ